MEFELDTDNNSPEGIAVSEFEAFVINTNDDKVYRYYNPENPLWASALFIDENSPYTVLATKPFELTGRRGRDGEGGGTTIIHQASSGSGSGTPGNSIAFIYRKSATTLSVAPRVNEGTYENGRLTAAPANWHLTVAEALLVDSTDNPMYISVVRLSGDGDTILSYSVPLEFTGPRGPPGNSIDLVFRRDNTIPTAPTANSGTRNGQELSAAPSGWELEASHTTGQDPLYVSIVTLPGSSTTDQSYSTPTRLTGPQGNSIRMIYLRHITKPVSPSAGSGTVAWNPNTPNTYRPPIGWTFTIPNTTETLWGVIVDLPGESTTETYGDVYQLSGEDGISGNSFGVVFRRSATLPSTPTGGTRTGNTLTGAPSDWHLTVSQATGSDNLYISIATLLGNSPTAITYETPIKITGERGREGKKGDSLKVIYLESVSKPSTPTGGLWDGSSYTAPSPWSENIPTRNLDDTELLWASIVELDVESTTPRYTGVIRLTGEKGREGQKGEKGTRGVGAEIIFREASTPPDAPLNGSGTWNPQTNAYTPPANWSLDSNTYSGVQNLYAVKVTLPGTSTTEIYGHVWRMNGQRGPVGIRGPPGIPGGTTGSGEDGDSLAAIYKRSNTNQDNTIIGVRPTGGTWDHSTNAFTAPSGWETDIPTGTETYIFMAVVTLHGEANSISYDLPVQLTGQRGATGTAGNPGGAGPRGERGISSGFLYQRSVSAPTQPTNGSGTFSDPNLTLTDWSTDTSVGTGLLYGVGWIYNSEGATPADQIKYTLVFQMEGPAGQRGAIGPQGNPGSGNGGNDGDSVILIFRASSSTLRTTPTGGSWNHSTFVFAPPSGWYTTYADAETAGNSGDPIYTAAVYLSGSSNVINAFSHPIRMTGEKGDRGERGERGEQGPPGIGEQGPPGQKGRNAPHVQIQYSVNGVIGTYEATVTNPYYIRFSTDGGSNWSTGVRFRQDGTDGTPGKAGTSAPQVQIQYSVDNAAFHNSVANPYYIRFSTDGGSNWSTGVRFRQDGTNGTQGIRGDGTEIIFREASTPPDSPLNGSGTWNPQTNVYTPPTDWSLDSNTYSGAQNLYAVKVTLPGASTTEIYGHVWRMNGQRGAVGIRGPPGPAGGTTGSGEDGDSLAAIYKRSNTNQDNTIIGVRPTGGTWDHSTNAFTAPSGWENDIPTGTETYIFMSVVTLHGEANSISYDLPVQLTGQRGAAGAVGNPGGTGPAGTDGLPGASVAYVYTASVGEPTSIRGQGQGLYNRTTNKISNPPSGWHTDPQALTGSQRQWISIADVVYTSQTAYTISYSDPEALTGSQGEQGQRGIPGTGGAGTGVNGDSSIYIYQRNTTPPANPAGGTWDHSTDTYTPPSGWYRSESAATGTGLLYGAVVTLSGSTNSILNYTNTIQLEGSQGERGLRGEQGERGPPGVGQQGIPGQRGRNAPYTQIQYSVDGSNGSYGANVTNPYFIRFSTDGGNSWSDGERFRQDGMDGSPGTSAPQLQIQYSTDNISYHNSVANPYFIRTSSDGGTSWSTGYRFRQDAPEVQIQYATTQAGSYSGSTANPYFIRFSTDGGTTWSSGQRFRQDGTNGNRGTNAPEVQIQYAVTQAGSYSGSTANPYFIRFSTDGGTTWSSGVRFRQDGTNGVKGDSIKSIFLRKATQPALPAGITVNANGRFTNLLSTQSAPNNDQWHAIPLPGTDPLWKQDIEIDWSSLTVTNLGNPYSGQGERGETGQRGTNAPATQIQYSILQAGPYAASVSNPYFIRFSTDGGTTWSSGQRFRQDGTNGAIGPAGTPAPRVRIQYSTDNSVFHDSVANPYFVRFSTDGGTTWSAGQRFRQDGTNGSTGPAGATGFSYQNYYHANTATTVTLPTITYNGSSFTAQSGWAATIPTTPAGANIFVVPVRYQVGTSGQTLDGIARFGEVPSSVVTPTRSTYSNGIDYGIANGNTPAGTVQNSASFSLSVGESHTTAGLSFPATTTGATNYYIRLPAGLILTRAVDSVQGVETSSWVRVGSTQVWIFTIGFQGAENTFTFTVRRDS